MGTPSPSPVIVIYDGDCRLCIASVNWVEQKVRITPLPFQQTDVEALGLTHAECAKEVHVICNGVVSRGAMAVAVLLQMRGNTVLSRLIYRFQGLADLGYRWVASHRNTFIVRLLTSILERATSRSK